MSKTSLMERARKHVLSRGRLADPVIDKSVAPESVAKNGSRVRITHGEITDMDGTKEIGSVGGKVGRIDGAPYVAKGGPQKGKVIQPVRLEGSTDLVGVPTERLTADDGSRGASRARVGWSRQYANNYDRIFGKSA